MLPVGVGSDTFRPKIAVNSRRDIARAPKLARCAVSCWQSTNQNPSRSNFRTKWMKPYLEALLTRVNIDSPKKHRPCTIPYNPPTKAPPSHTSTEWACPNRCSSSYAARISSVIQVRHGPSSLRWHPSITAPNARSIVTVNFLWLK